MYMYSLIDEQCQAAARQRRDLERPVSPPCDICGAPATTSIETGHGGWVCLCADPDHRRQAVRRLAKEERRYLATF